MIHLRDGQLEAFREEARAGLADRLARRGEERFPEKAAGRSRDELRAEARRLSAAARERGFVSEEEVTLFYDLSLELGPGFEQGPAGAWAREVLKERTVPPRERLERLRERVGAAETWDPHREDARRVVTGRVTRVVGKGPPPRLGVLGRRLTELDALVSRLRAADTAGRPDGPEAAAEALPRAERALLRARTEHALRLDLERSAGRGRETAKALRAEAHPAKRRELEKGLERLRRRHAMALVELREHLAEEAPRPGSADAEEPCVARVASDQISRLAAIREEAERKLRLARDLGVVSGTADEGDRVVVAVELSRMPGDTLDLLRRGGTKVLACRGSVVDCRRDLASMRPRGWPAGATWEDVPGLYDGPRNEVVVATRGHAPGRSGRVPATGDGHASASLAVHVACHAIDARWGGPSSSAEFRSARGADLDALPEYCRQPGTAGLDESWAESAARWAAGEDEMKASIPGLHAYWREREARRAGGRAAAEAGDVRTTRIWRRSSIGAASLDDDGAIVLDLRASDGRGILGDGRVIVPPGDARFRAVLAHLGGLAPGETKQVPPWPEANR